MSRWGNQVRVGVVLAAAAGMGAATVMAGCSLVLPFSCTKEGSAASDRLVKDLESLSSVTRASVSTDCDSGGENYVMFVTTTVQAGRDEFQALPYCKPGDLPAFESAETGSGFRCDFPSGPASVFLVANQDMDMNQAVVKEP